MNKGFTLMEVLAVVMVLALVGAMAVPSFRSVNSEQKFRRAKIGAVKIAQAIRTSLRNGEKLPYNKFFVGTVTDPDVPETEGGFLPTDHDIGYEVCSSTGIPRRSLGMKTIDGGFKRMFFCGDLRPEDFIGLPYMFMYKKSEDAAPDDDYESSRVIMTGVDGAGSKYQEKQCWVTIGNPGEVSCEDGL